MRAAWLSTTTGPRVCRRRVARIAGYTSSVACNAMQRCNASLIHCLEIICGECLAAACLGFECLGIVHFPVTLLRCTSRRHLHLSCGAHPMKPAACPSREELSAFILGKLAEE